jgi:hypothetical protein
MELGWKSVDELLEHGANITKIFFIILPSLIMSLYTCANLKNI